MSLGIVAANTGGIHRVRPSNLLKCIFTIKGIIMNIYQSEGFANRREYLEDLADNFGIDVKTVFTLASILGSNEDFDGLVTALEDFEMTGEL